MRLVTSANVVFDANVFVRAAIDGHARAKEWLRAVESGAAQLLVPDIVWVEVGQALKGYVGAGALSPEQASEFAATIATFPAENTSVRSLLPAALKTSLRFDLTVYDACYYALAAAAEAVLVTFDRHLAVYKRTDLLG